MMRLHAVLWIMLASLNTRAQAQMLSQLTAALPDVPAPPRGEAQWVARSMKMNGLPMTLKTFQSRLSPHDVVSYYEQHSYGWGRNEFRRISEGGKQRLGIRSSSYYISIDARPAPGGSEGTILVSVPPERAAADLRSGFPQPRSSRLLNRHEYDDAGIRSEHLSLTSARSPALEARAYAQLLSRDGWQILRQEPMRTQARGVVIEAQRGPQLALLTLQPDESRSGATAIIVVWKKS